MDSDQAPSADQLADLGHGLDADQPEVLGTVLEDAADQLEVWAQLLNLHNSQNLGAVPNPARPLVDRTSTPDQTRARVKVLCREVRSFAICRSRKQRRSKQRRRSARLSSGSAHNPF